MTTQTPPEPPVTVDAQTLEILKWLEAIHHETKVASSRLGILVAFGVLSLMGAVINFILGSLVR
jgi:hypothetical protein